MPDAEDLLRIGDGDVYPGHEATDVEAIIERRHGYDIVEKDTGAVERIAEQTDPRAG